MYKGRRKHTGQTVALKFISKHGKSTKDIRNLRQEISILRTLNHENIILMFDAFETEREFCVVTEYAQVRGRNGGIAKSIVVLKFVQSLVSRETLYCSHSEGRKG